MQVWVSDYSAEPAHDAQQHDCGEVTSKVCAVDQRLTCTCTQVDWLVRVLEVRLRRGHSRGVRATYEGLTFFTTFEVSQ